MARLHVNPCRVERSYYEWGWIGITTRRKRTPVYEVILTWEIDNTGDDDEDIPATDTHTRSGKTVLVQSIVPELAHGERTGLLTVTYRAEGEDEAYP